MGDEQLYCKVFVDASRDEGWLMAKIATCVGGKVVGWTVESAILTVDTRKNEDFDPVRKDGPDGFLYFRYYLDVLPAKGVARTPYIESVGRLLAGVWECGMAAVAACDFEDELPSSPEGRSLR